MSPSPSADPLILDFYAKCTNPAHWPRVLDRLCTEMGLFSAAVQCIEVTETVMVPWIACDTRVNVDAYEAKISKDRNPRLEAHRFLWAPQGPSVLTDDQIFMDWERSRARHLQDQLREIHLGRFLGGLMPIGNGRYMALAMHRHSTDERDFSEEQRDRIKELIPHIAQAMQISLEVAGCRSLQALKGYLESWAFGLVVCDRNAKAEWFNHRAVQLLNNTAAQRPLRHAFRALNASAQLDEALRQVDADGIPHFQNIETAQGRLHMVTQPLGGCSEAEDSRFLLVLSAADAVGHVPVNALRGLFDLTDAEARLASALVAGTTVEQYAQRRGITAGTARSQLNKVLLKTGAHRQADLVRRVLCATTPHIMGNVEFGQHSKFLASVPRWI